MKIAIIGAGAAGSFAAANLPYREDLEVIVFEKTGKDLQKVKVSGGGRCNVTHACFEVPELIQRYPRGKNLLRKTLYEFGPEDTIRWFEERGVTLKTETDGRMFPETDESQTIIDCIRKQMQKNRVSVQYHKSVERIERTGSAFRLHFADKASFTADKILIACGGFPKAEQYAWLKDLGHSFQPPVPSLFTFNMPKHPITQLMGVSVPDATVKISGTKFSETGPLLITHWGMSGPVVLRLSAWAARELHERNYMFEIRVNWLNDRKENELKEELQEMRRSQGKQVIAARSAFGLPKRLWEYFLEKASVHPDERWGDLPSAKQQRLVESLLNDRYEVSGKTTFKEEFVTCGGIPLSEIDPATMESRIVSGIYFAGEIIDVDGITGGFNFQHAWASGFVAAENMIR
jgi:hypothetical protein